MPYGTPKNFEIKLKYAIEICEGLKYLQSHNLKRRELSSLSIFVDKMAKIANFSIDQKQLILETKTNNNNVRRFLFY